MNTNYISKEERKKMTIICFDTETTGFADDDEIIQLSIANAQTGEEMLNEYFRPSDFLMERGWDDAARVTGIYPDDVADCRSLSDPDVFDEVQAIFNSAELVVGYHVFYDIAMMEHHGFDMSRYIYQDPMYAFATYYWTTHPGEKHISKKSGKECDPFLKWKDDGFGGKGQYINKNLSFAAEYLCNITDFGAHNSMNDVWATADVWAAMNEIQEDVYFRGYAYDDDGNAILDANGDQVYEDENGAPMINGNGYGFLYVYDYTRDQLATLDA